MSHRCQRRLGSATAVSKTGKAEKKILIQEKSFDLNCLVHSSVYLGKTGRYHFYTQIAKDRTYRQTRVMSLQPMDIKQPVSKSVVRSERT